MYNCGSRQDTCDAVEYKQNSFLTLRVSGETAETKEHARWQPQQAYLQSRCSGGKAQVNDTDSTIYPNT